MSEWLTKASKELDDAAFTRACILYYRLGRKYRNLLDNNGWVQCQKCGGVYHPIKNASKWGQLRVHTCKGLKI